MLSYAAHRRPARALDARTLLLVAAGHAALLVAVMTARGDIAMPGTPQKTDVVFVDPVAPPPPPPPEPEPRPAEPSRSVLDTPPAKVPLPPLGPSLPPQPAVPIPQGPAIGTAPVPVPVPALPPLPKVAPVTIAARSLTAAADLIPPYPEDKRRLGEEAVLRLVLSIDPRGRVSAVEPVGAADPAFLEAARRHIVKRWRYKPASEGGAAVASTTTVSIRFQLER